MSNDTIYIDEMECVPINELGDVIDNEGNNDESSKRIFGGGNANENDFSFFGSSGRGSISSDFFYGVIIIGFIYSVGDYLFNGMPQGIVAKKLLHA